MLRGDGANPFPPGPPPDNDDGDGEPIFGPYGVVATTGTGASTGELRPGDGEGDEENALPVPPGIVEEEGEKKN